MKYLRTLRLDSWPVLLTGLVLAAVVSCMAATTPTTTTTTTSGWTTTMVASSALSASSPSAARTAHTTYYTPYPFATILNDTLPMPAVTAVPSLAARTRYLISPATGQYLSMATPATGTPGTAAGLGTNAAASTVSYGTLLAEVFEAVPDPNDATAFRLDSDLHSLWSLDAATASSTSLVFHNNWGTLNLAASPGYLVFRYNAGTKKLVVRGRYAYNTTTYAHAETSSDLDTTLANKEVAVSGSTWSLAASGSGTELTLYTAPVSVGTPTDFYPNGTAYVSNSRVSVTSYISHSATSLDTEVQSGLLSTYSAQVAASGDDSGTATAASTMLDTIETTLTSEGAGLRYPKALYLAYRKAALNLLLSSDDLVNGVPGMHAVPYAYFTNAADSGGVHHPFLVLATYSVTDKPNRLVDVRRPPGDGLTNGYESQSVTRDATLGNYLIKIPLRDYGEVSSLSENTYRTTLKSDGSYTDTDSVYNKASISGLGVMLDGSPIYPVMNNTLVPSQSAAELTSLGNHVGRGMELHYHADGHLALNNDFQLYNMNDYIGQDHPPLIGFGFDGVALYGAYESEYPSMLGIDVALDVYGGHSHGVYGYHYHSHLVSATTTTGTAYTLEVLIPGAWGGKINDIPEFWDAVGTSGVRPSYASSQHHVYVGRN